MFKTNVSALLKSAATVLKKHAPEILTGVGVVGMIATTVIAVQATPKAMRLIEEKKKDEGKEKLTPAETVSTVWKCYVPAASVGVLSAACVIGASSVGLKRNTALAAACTLSENALREYSEKVVETVGEEKEQEVRERVVQDKLDKAKRDGIEAAASTSAGGVRCYDPFSGREFSADIESLRKAVNELNEGLLREGSVSLNDLYYILGQDDIIPGEILGWNIVNGLVEPRFDSILANDGTPCLVMDFSRRPRYDFSRRVTLSR